MDLTDIERVCRELGQVNLALSLDAHVKEQMSVISCSLDEIEEALNQTRAKLMAEQKVTAKVAALLNQMTAIAQTTFKQDKASTATQTHKQQQHHHQQHHHPNPSSHTLLSPLSAEEFESVPKYLKGRLTLDKLNAWVDCLVKVFAEKYSVIKANPARLSGEQRRLYYEWRDQECEECRGQHFVTETDIKVLCQGKGPKLDPTGRSIVAILRHCGRLREVRSTGIIRFVLN